MKEKKTQIEVRWNSFAAPENWHNSQAVSMCNRTIVAASFAIRVQLAYTRIKRMNANDRLHSIVFYVGLSKPTSNLMQLVS